MARYPTDLVPINSDILARIHAEIKRTGIHPDRVIASSKAPPPALKYNMPEKWFTSPEPQSVRQAHLDWIFATYHDLPTVQVAHVRPKYSIDGKTKRLPISEAYRERVRQEVTRTGLSPQMLLKRRPDAPKGITTTSLSRWMSGEMKSEQPIKLNWLLSAYEEQIGKCNIDPNSR